MTWQNAKTHCENLDGYLATITSEEENQFVYTNLVSPVSGFSWLGGTVETNISPKDSGTITKSPDKTSYSPNEEVTLTATPAKGYKFKQWQGDASGSEATTI